MFKVGQWVLDLVKNEKVQIIEQNEVWGFVSYKVFNPLTNEPPMPPAAQPRMKMSEVVVYTFNILSKLIITGF